MSGGKGDQSSSFTTADYESPTYRWRNDKTMKGSMRVEVFYFQYKDKIGYPERWPGNDGGCKTCGKKFKHNQDEYNSHRNICHDVPDITCLKALFGTDGKDGFFSEAYGIEVNNKGEDQEFENHCHNNRSKQELERQLEKIADDEKNSEYDCFLFMFLCYGERENVIICDDGQKMEIKDLIDPFKGKMLMKPKLFFFQACDKDRAKEEERKGEGEEPKKEFITKKIPLEADFLTIHCDIPGTFAWKDAKPSYFIESLREAFEGNKNPTRDLLSLTTRINGLMKDKKEGNTIAKKMHVPRVTSTLTKLLYFTEPPKPQQ